MARAREVSKREGRMVAQIALRTRFFDDALLAGLAAAPGAQARIQPHPPGSPFSAALLPRPLRAWTSPSQKCCPKP